MRSINIDDETYRFLQSKAIPYEEQPVDTIKRLLGIGINIVDNQPSNQNSNNSNTTGADQGSKPVAGAVAVDKRQELREFYSKILDRNNSNVQEIDNSIALKAHNSNGSLESHSNTGSLLENRSNLMEYSNSRVSQDSNSNERFDPNSNQELENTLYSKQDLSYASHKSAVLPPTIPSKAADNSKISNLGSGQGGPKSKKKPKTSLPELIRAGILKENERLIFQNYRGVKFPQYEVTISDGLLKWNGSRYSMSDLASKLLKDLDPSQDNEFVRGPILWINAAGKTIADLWEKYLAQKGA